MKLQGFFLITFFFALNIYAQTNRYNCMIFIDGMMPYGVTKSYFEYKDSLDDIRIIDFTYTLGDIILSAENNRILRSLKSEQLLKLNITVTNKQGSAKSYQGEIAAGWLDYNYVLIRITNLKKGKYYFAYSTPGVIKAWIRKEYRMINDK